MNNKQKKTLTILSILVIILIIVVAIVTNIPEQEVVTEKQLVEIANTKIENKAINKLAEMNEEERMRYYVSEFMNALELKKYTEAYEMLNADFKDNYFKTFIEFEQYASSKFPTDISVEYTNFERSGEFYIFWLTLRNPLTSSKDEGKEMNVVVKENDLNKFELSFSVEK